MGDNELPSRQCPRDAGHIAYVSVNKALVTQASSAIPVVPLYISILYKLMKAKGTHEGCIEQIQRLFAEKVYTADDKPVLDAQQRLRVDDWEMEEDIQNGVKEIWPKIDSASLRELSDFDGYQKEFLKLFGFGLDGVDYAAPTQLERDLSA